MVRTPLWKLLFGFTAPVDRRAYVTAGVALMALKYALDALLVHQVTGAFLTPLAFFNPLLSQRLPEPTPPLLAASMAILALPFLWIGVSMSLRRAVDAGRSPWLAVLFLVPGLNYLGMLLLSVLPSRPPLQSQADPDQRGPAREFPAAMIGVALAAAIGVISVAFTALVSKSYGMSLFFLTPFAMGAGSSFVLNRARRHTVMQSLGVAMISVTMAALGMLLFALEGGICIAMAAPIAAVAASFGALIGREIAANTASRRAGAALLFLLPITSALEPSVRPSPLYEVSTSVEIDAPPEVVWQHVISFPELPAPDDLIFRIGIAYPLRARIEGSGVGAIRYCEFSTGPFVEPITRWDAPRTLSFAVSAQPPGMKEWSVYSVIHPPHLDSSIRSERGEFRLIRLEGNRTRLEGSTWYRLGLSPAPYWRLWSEPMLHDIHARVLNHVKALSESRG
jgi:uncharacterized membrane protein YhaH (DUF805 family)